MKVTICTNNEILEQHFIGDGFSESETEEIHAKVNWDCVIDTAETCGVDFDQIVLDSDFKNWRGGKYAVDKYKSYSKGIVVSDDLSQVECDFIYMAIEQEYNQAKMIVELDR